MYEWYQGACECYVHLSDVAENPAEPRNITRFNQLSGLVLGIKGPLLSELTNSSWFCRGWTLQELLAPQAVIICNANWQVIGHVHGFPWLSVDVELEIKELCGPYLLPEVSRITNIPKAFLNRRAPLGRASVAQRMSWAAHRRTTRVEDEAYCLLGIFGINIPLLYGEGRGAFLRLQGEIIRRTTDQSIFAWDDKHIIYPRAVLAESPRWFLSADEEQERCHIYRQPYTITNNGLELRAKLSTGSPVLGGDGTMHLLTLNYSRTNGEPFGILLSKRPDFDVYERCNPKFNLVPLEGKWKMMEEQLIYLRTGPEIVTGG